MIRARLTTIAVVAMAVAFGQSALAAPPEDLGKVIGRQGRTAKAVRTLLGAAGMKLKKRYTLEILED